MDEFERSLKDQPTRIAGLQTVLPPFITEKPDGLFLKVFVQPKASKNSIAGFYGDALKIKLTAPPVEGAANKMCLKYLAKCLGVSPSSLDIVSGHSSRTKRILIRLENNAVSRNEKKLLIEKLLRLLPPQ